MDLLTTLFDLEECFWTEGSDFYDEHLAADSLMLFPGMGMLERDGILFHQQSPTG